MGLFQRADPPHPTVVRFRPEQRFLHAFGRDGGRVEYDERTRRPVGKAMDRAADQFLARS